MSVHEDMSRGGQPASLQRNMRAKTRKGQPRETRRAPGVPRNSYSVVFGLRVDWEGGLGEDMEAVMVVCSRQLTQRFVFSRWRLWEIPGSIRHNLYTIKFQLPDLGSLRCNPSCKNNSHSMLPDEAKGCLKCWSDTACVDRDTSQIRVCYRALPRLYRNQQLLAPRNSIVKCGNHD